MKFFTNDLGQVYAIDAAPADTDPRLGGLAFTPDGEVYVTTVQNAADSFISGGLRVSPTGRLVVTDGVAAGRPYDYNAGLPSDKREANTGDMIRQFADPTGTNASVGGVLIGELGGVYFVSKVARVAQPVFSPAPGQFSSNTPVTITCATPNTTIRYTLDGTDPSPTVGTIYSGAIIVSALATTIKAIAYDNASVLLPSYIITGNYYVGTVAAPNVSPTPGEYAGAQTITLTTSTPGAAIRYTTDGTVPLPTYGVVYTGPFLLTASAEVKAIAYNNQNFNSPVTTVAYIINGNVATPTFSPLPGTYGPTQSVTISCATASAVIHYTTDGSTPSATSPTYSTPVVISVTSTLKAIAVKSLWLDSTVAQGLYQIGGVVSVATFFPPSGQYDDPQNIAISSATAGASIRYTTDGSLPTSSHGTIYTSPVLLTAPTTLKAIAYNGVLLDSPVTFANYNIGPAVTFTLLDDAAVEDLLDDDSLNLLMTDGSPASGFSSGFDIGFGA